MAASRQGSGKPPRVVVGNLSAPELDRLAAALCQAGVLETYVRRYVNRRRPLERLLERIPWLSGPYRRTLGRRRLPAGLDGARVVEAGVLRDWAFALASRAPKGWRHRFRGFMQGLLVNTEIAISREAAGRVEGASHVVASYGTALDAFRAAGPGRVKVLNYPIAHHQYQFDCYAEERALNPDFAGMLPSFDWPAGYQARLEAEIALADRILVGSRFVQRSFTAQGIEASRIHVEPYGVDTSRFGPAPAAGLRRDSFRALYVGQIGQRKGVSYLLEAWRRFHGPGTELLLVGGVVGDPAPLDARAGLFRHQPFVPQAELPGLYHSADVFVFPTLIEGMGLVVVEAMACGLPVICTDRGPDDLVRDGVEGFIVPIRDPGAIAERLERLRADPDLRARMSRAALARAQEFTWARYCAGALAVVLQEADT